MNDDVALVAALRARDAGVVREDAEIPDRALRPLVAYVTAADDVDDAPDTAWQLAREIFADVTMEAAYEKGVMEV